MEGIQPDQKKVQGSVEMTAPINKQHLGDSDLHE